MVFIEPNINDVFRDLILYEASSLTTIAAPPLLQQQFPVDSKFANLCGVQTNWDTNHLHKAVAAHHTVPAAFPILKLSAGLTAEISRATRACLPGEAAGG